MGYLNMEGKIIQHEWKKKDRDGVRSKNGGGEGGGVGLVHDKPG
jgi:hypothetical protein